MQPARSTVERSRGRWHTALLVRFALVGISNTVVDVALFFLLFRVLGIFYLVAQVFSYLGGVTNSYCWNKFWTFRAKTASDRREFGKFITVNGVSFAVSLAALYGLGHDLHLDIGVSKVLATAGSMGINFIGSRFWVFRGWDGSGPPAQDPERPIIELSSMCE